MDEKKKQRIMIWIAVGVFVALGIIFLATSGDKTTTDIKESIIGTNIDENSGVVSAPVPNNAEVPQASAVSRENLPEGTIELVSSLTGFSPNSFSVKAGQKITLAITSKDKSHTFAFKDPTLASVALNAGAGQTSAVNFIAPTKKGEYAFRCDLPGHEDNGEVGKMIVE